MLAQHWYSEADFCQVRHWHFRVKWQSQRYLHRPPKLDPLDALASSLVEAGPISLISASFLSLPQGLTKAKTKQARLKLAFST